MRYILIDLSSDNYLQQPNLFGGYEGEHNETILQVKLPKRMIDIECSGYRFDFQTSEDNKISSPLIPVSELNNDILSFHLTQQLTISGKLLFNVVAILSDEKTISLISKTNTVVLHIENAADGNIQPLDPNGYKDELQKMVDERIAEINPAKVDQTYDLTSENAQSGKAVAEAINAIPQADWQQNDSTAKDYVKNRTGGYDDVSEVISNVTVTPSSDNTLPIVLQVGKSYIVTADGVDYTVVGIDGPNYIYIGNGSMLGGEGEDTGEPFHIYCIPEASESSTVYFAEENIAHTITIKTSVAIPFPNKYIDTEGLKDTFVSKDNVDQTYSATSSNPQSGTAVAEALSPVRQTITIDTPVWTTQPTIDGALNDEFVTWESKAYYMTLKDTDGTALESGQFKLCTALDGYASAIDRIFTLESSDITLSENKPVDFKTISSDRTTFEMRDAGVTGIKINTKNLKSQRFIFSVLQSNISMKNDSYRYVCVKESAGYSYGAGGAYYSPTGQYNGYNGFLFQVAEPNTALLCDIGYKIEINRTKSGLVASCSGLASTTKTFYSYGFSDVSSQTEDFRQTDLSWLSLYTVSKSIYYGNGTVVTLEEFA